MIITNKIHSAKARNTVQLMHNKIRHSYAVCQADSSTDTLHLNSNFFYTVLHILVNLYLLVWLQWWGYIKDVTFAYILTSMDCIISLCISVNNCGTRFVNGDNKTVPLFARKALRGERGTALPILDLGSRSGWSTLRPGSLDLVKGPGTHLIGVGGGPRGPYGWVRKISAPTGVRTADRPARSESLYRLSHPSNGDNTLLCVHVMLQGDRYLHAILVILVSAKRQYRTSLFFLFITQKISNLGLYFEPSVTARGVLLAETVTFSASVPWEIETGVDNKRSFGHKNIVMFKF
jgi:hypothetical protein